MYKIETHLHTLYGAGCGKMEEKEIVSRYLDAGYAAVVVTDHYNRRTSWYPEFCADRSQNAAVLFLRGFRKVQEEGARRGLRVYKGAELRFDESINDFLLYNYDDALLEDPEELFGMGLERFYERASAQGALLLQAHPCRSSSQPPCFPADTRFLDGVEVRNGNPRADNHNDLALELARKDARLLALSGSDCHEPQDVARGGIELEILPENERQLCELLRVRKYRLL